MSVSINAKCFYVFLAHVLESQLGVSNASLPSGELPIEDVFWYAAIIHAVYMAQPAESALPQKGEHAS